MSFQGEQKVKGKIYVYEATAIWNAKKQRSEQKRIYIGTKDAQTGKFVPNKKYYELHGGEPSDKSTDKPQKPLSIISSQVYGTVALMRYASDVMGLTTILKDVFPEHWENILSCAMHTCSENEPLYLCKPWAEDSFGMAAPSSQRISELLLKLDEDKRMTFYKQWAKLRTDREYLALDITSISSWSELIQYVEPGYNRDHEQLPQINLAMLFGEDSKLPVFCKLYPGSIHDVSTLEGITTFIDEIKLNQMHFAMDKGFYSEAGVKPLLQKYIKFAIGVPFSTDVANELVNDCMDELGSSSNAIMIGDSIYYAKTYMDTFCDRRVYYHVYYDESHHAQEKEHVMQKVLSLEKQLVDGTLKITDKQAGRYFSFNKNKDGSYNIHRKTDVIDAEKRLAGYFVILTNHYKNPTEVLEIYRMKDVVEKSFDNLKNDLDLERLRIHTDKAMEGRIFIGFISLIIMSYIREQMRINNVYGKFSYNELIAELKKIKITTFQDGRKLMTEISATQKYIFKSMGMKVPTPV
jgi:transposase